MVHALKNSRRNIGTGDYVYYIHASKVKVRGERRMARYEAAALSQPPIQPNRDTKHDCHRAQSCQRRRQMILLDSVVVYSYT